MTLTTKQIKTLRTEAERAGDIRTVGLCNEWLRDGESMDAARLESLCDALTASLVLE